MKRTDKGDAVGFLELRICAMIGSDRTDVTTYMYPLGTLRATVHVIGWDVKTLTHALTDHVASLIERKAKPLFKNAKSA